MVVIVNILLCRFRLLRNHARAHTHTHTLLKRCPSVPRYYPSILPIKLHMNLLRKSPCKPGVLTSWTKQRQNTGTCGARGLKCKTQNVKCTLLHTPAVPAVAENTNEIDSAATQPKLRRMNASTNLSEYFAECSQSVESQCGNEAGAADSPDSAEHIWQAPLPKSEGRCNDRLRGHLHDGNDDLVADRFRKAARAIDERRDFITEYMSEDDDGHELCHRRYYIDGCEVTQHYFDLTPTRDPIEVISIGGPGRSKENTAVAGNPFFSI